MMIVRRFRAFVLVVMLFVTWIGAQADDLSYRSAPMTVCISNTYSVVLDYEASETSSVPRTIVVNLLNAGNGWSWHGGTLFPEIAAGSSGTVTARVTVLGSAALGSNYLWSSFIGPNSDWQQAYRLVEQGGVVVREPDADEDGLTDAYELQFSGTTTGMVSNADDDGDGFSNWNEFMAGTCPTNGADYLGAWVMTTNGIPGSFVRWKSCAGRSYNVERSTNLLAPRTAIAINVSATPPMNVCYDSSAIGGGPYFYRIKVMP